MKNILSLFFWLCFTITGYTQITLSHNVGNTPIDTGMPNCQYDEHWARVFTLSEFGISTTEQFIIKSGQVAISKSYEGARLSVSVLSIDSNFPNSKPKPLGYGGAIEIPYIDGVPQIIQIEFSIPVVVPAEVERILVVASQPDDVYNPNYTDIVIAGTEEDKDVSWFAGCREYYSFITTDKLSTPVPNANFFINVTGEKFNNKSLGATTTLTHNVCDQPIWVNERGCSGGSINFARRFVLDDFGISNNEEFIINNGQVAFSAVGAWDVRIQFNIYRIDSNFPTSFSTTDLIGSSQVLRLPSSSDRNNPKIFNLEFENPIVVPRDVENILVEVYHLWSTGYSAAFIAGTEIDNDVSWSKSNTPGCTPFGVYESRNTSYYINVTGNVNHVTNNFEMNISNICSEFLKEFSVEKKENVASVVWDFGDPTSGITNTSTDLSPFHDFSADGTYTITATVTGKDGSVEVLTETIDVKEPPNVYGINNVYACEDTINTGISSSFNVSNIESQVLGGQTDKTITYIDGSGKSYNTLPNPFTNTIKDRETITVRVSHKNNPCCYSETSFDLIVNPLPNTNNIADINLCDDDTDGFALFNLQQVKTDVIGTETNIQVEFFHQNGQQIVPPLNAINNLVVNEELITVKTKNTDSNCSTEKTFKLIVNPLPIANPLQELIGCDDNNDGISEYFDTTNIQSQVLGNQTGMEVTYFKTNGNQLPSSLPNPYTNTISNQEIITVRVTNTQTSCYAETPLVLKTASQPQILKPSNRYACDEGSGYANFDIANIGTEIIGNQNGLRITYFDPVGNQLSSPFSTSFKNTTAWYQTIYVKVENELNSLCYSETSFDLVVNNLPAVTIEDTYFLCNLEPSLAISVKNNLDSYTWEYQDGTIISNTYEANLEKAGGYKLTVGENKNGIYCENSFDFELIRSELPNITNVEYQELSDENFIQVNASGDGDFEYSIDGVNFQNSNTFNNILGGIYTVFVRDELGCGNDSEKVTIIDYPKYFTPNNDNVNDTWHIKGITDFPNVEVYIYDRYGKLLKKLNINSIGWDGTFRGEKMVPTDYWFTVKLNNETEFKGHFSLRL
ncbi:T9SS type B sorting domain-containing protein [Mariniflexile sp. HNIBRBA6329]|uniref:T9SS type B sorting domain-containing protein n=1 Tax=Mariniflexile sp. HNIBRBA6329 TaxID=3373088 RepID=UPI00374581A5